MIQDFTKKMIIVVCDDVASWQLTNTIGHITAYLGNKISEPFDTGKYFTSKDDLNYPRNSQYAIVTLKATREELFNLNLKLQEKNLLWIAYVQEMIDMIDDEELAKALSNKTSKDINILGIGVFGEKEILKDLTGSFKLWK